MDRIRDILDYFGGCDQMNLTFVHSKELAPVAESLGGDISTSSPCTIVAALAEATDAYTKHGGTPWEDPEATLLLNHFGDWVAIYEPASMNALEGMRFYQLSRKYGQAVNIKWNITGAGRVKYWKDGQAALEFKLNQPELRAGFMADQADSLLADLNFAWRDPALPRNSWVVPWRESAFQLIERITGHRFSKSWFATEPHHRIRVPRH
ncbi:hypothetical protein Aple_095350 [Acrocarpospora pleiomorpha]|uniref:Uncharacterized protein n=1 Tax=Acrocarpospora pleiomorpha TaxID=90975 RepID=A0A5M3Y0A6_9ACTN|nr:DUF6461 domain-containing protein [Acrocarpospora pleiomorpha]GES26636.1 hypothetical protein Aple_095350 [Acrocarpospora pleiomorpha]